MEFHHQEGNDQYQNHGRELFLRKDYMKKVISETMNVPNLYDRLGCSLRDYNYIYEQMRLWPDRGAETKLELIFQQTLWQILSLQRNSTE